MTGRLSDRVGRRKAFVVVAGVVYALAMVVIATASGPGRYLVGMGIGGFGFGMYVAVGLALVVDVLPESGSAAKDLGVLNIAGALPFSLAPALAPGVLAVSDTCDTVLYLAERASAKDGRPALRRTTMAQGPVGRSASGLR